MDDMANANGAGSGLADRVLINGNVITVDDRFSIVSAVAIRGNRIVAVGSNDEIQALTGPKTEVIDCTGRTILPGMIDPHGHIHSLGRVLENLDLKDTRSYQDVIDMVAARVATLAPGEWVIGQGWDENTWADRSFPSHESLSAVSPYNPVILNRIDCHAILSNECAMQLAGITNDTPDPDGGKILRDADGVATGVFIDHAENLIRDHEPVTDELIARRLKLSSQALLACGITAFHELGVSPQEYEVYRKADEAGEMDVRLRGLFDDPSDPDACEVLFKTAVIPVSEDRFFAINGIKLFSDGALGSRGALMHEPYSDDPGNYGILVTGEDYIRDITTRALGHGLQVITHAIGDAAIHLTLNAYEAAIKATGATDHRLRLEHAQIMTPSDIGRFAELGVITCVQPGSAISDMDWTATRVGPERTMGAYRFREILDSGSILPISSDTPIESFNPFQTIYRAVTRQNEDGEPDSGWFPDQKLTREEAIKAHTIWAAYSGFQDHLIGSLEPGKLADVIVVDQDLMTCPEQDLHKTRVLLAMVDGKMKYNHLEQQEATV